MMAPGRPCNHGARKSPAGLPGKRFERTASGTVVVLQPAYVIRVDGPPMSCPLVDPKVGGARARTTPSAPMGEPSAFFLLPATSLGHVDSLRQKLLTGMAVFGSGSLLGL